MSTARRLRRIRILALCPSRDSVALVRRALFACGDVELLGVAGHVDEVLAGAGEWHPDVVLVALGQKVDHEALLGGLKRLGGIAVAGLQESPHASASARREAAGMPILTMPLTLDQLSSLVSAHARQAALTATRSGQAPFLERLVVRAKGLVQLLPVSEIVWIEALHNAVLLHTEHGDSRLRSSISALARELSPEHFVRIHRSHIVNLDHVTQFRVNTQGQYSAITPDGLALNVGRTYQSALLLRLQRG